ncbi:MAG: hypothetical protein HWN79_13210 [Candidatus Lokiarchaeota archaeon]|nr:hypothetical protein [Candidatus Lokiarchaeota archaeon]
MRNYKYQDGCSSWNYCDETLKENINRCNYVQIVRNQLKKKKLEKKFRK